MDNPEVIVHIGQQYLQDYITMGVVTLDTKKQTFNIIFYSLVGILVKRGEVQTEVHTQAINGMKQWISSVIKLTPAIYKVTKHKTLDNV
jgi:hypothetical protein